MHNVPLPLGTLSFMCLLSMHMRLAPIYIHKAGSMCFVPDITSASPQVVSMRFFKCLSILCLDYFDTEMIEPEQERNDAIEEIDNEDDDDDSDMMTNHLLIPNVRFYMYAIK